MSSAFHGPGVDPDAATHDPITVPRPVDDDIDAGYRTPLDELRDFAATAYTPPPQTYPVPSRPRWSVRYSCSIDGDKIARWASRSQDRKKPGGLDQLKWACLVLANQCEAILKDGDPVGANGEDVTFRDDDILHLLAAPSAAAAVRLFYGGQDHVGDGYIVAQAFDLLRAAGYDESGARTVDDEAADPTRRSSTT